MKRLLAVLMATFVVLTSATPANAAQQCQEVSGVGSLCLIVENGRAIVTGPSDISLSVDVPPVIVEVPIPGPTQTVTVPPPAPVTVTRTAAPTTVTRTATSTETVTITEVPTPATTTVTARPTFTPPSLATPPVVTSAGQDRGKPDTIIERVVRNVGIPLLWIVIGIVLAIPFQYLMYAMGRSDAKHADDKFLEGILNRKKN